MYHEENITNLKEKIFLQKIKKLLYILIKMYYNNFIYIYIIK